MHKISSPLTASLLLIAMGLSQAVAETASVPVAPNPAPTATPGAVSIAPTPAPAEAASTAVAPVAAPVVSAAPAEGVGESAPRPFQWPVHGKEPCAHKHNEKPAEGEPPCPHHGPRPHPRGQGMGPGQGQMMGMGPGGGQGMGLPPRGMGPGGQGMGMPPQGMVPGQGRGFGPQGFARQGMIPPRLLALDLSDEQSEAIEKLLEEHAKARQAHMADVQASYAKLGELHAAEQRDLDAIGAAYEQMFKVRREGIMGMLRLHDAIDAVLTDEQRQRLGPMQRPRVMRR